MNAEFFDALLEAGASREKAMAAAVSVAQGGHVSTKDRQLLERLMDRPPDMLMLEKALQQIAEELREIRAVLVRIETRRDPSQ
jgi:hypothetical protein